MKTLPVLLSDFYKQDHARQYDPNITKIVSYYVPRKSRIKEFDNVVFFGLQAFIKEYQKLSIEDKKEMYDFCRFKNSLRDGAEIKEECDCNYSGAESERKNCSENCRKKSLDISKTGWYSVKDV